MAPPRDLPVIPLVSPRNPLSNSSTLPTVVVVSTIIKVKVNLEKSHRKSLGTPSASHRHLVAPEARDYYYHYYYYYLTGTVSQLKPEKPPTRSSYFLFIIIIIIYYDLIGTLSQPNPEKPLLF